MITKFSHSISIDPPKAVIVLTPGSHGDGRGMIRDREWQVFAAEHGCALVGCYFADDRPTGIEQYCDIQGNGDEGGQALLHFITDAVGKRSSTELPPLLLWGFSAGGQFSYEFTCAYPEYVAGFVVNKGGIYYTALADPAARAVPGLFITGERDSLWRKKIVEGIWAVNHAMGANWKHIEETDTSHEIGASADLGRKFFEHILKGIK